jgi:RimJ/RimL family protein N-acetyltransferase
MQLAPVTLEGVVVRLVPLAREHAGDLIEAGADADLFRYSPAPDGTPAGMRSYVAAAIADREAGRALPFAIVHRATSRAIGSSRFAAIAPEHRRLEIGWTWLARPFHGTAVNTEAKLLMLGHAFDTLECNRVEFKTDALNLRSRAALRAIGATEEGVFRRHMIMPDGRVRDSAYFSIVRDEWPRVRAHLVARLTARRDER